MVLEFFTDYFPLAAPGLMLTVLGGAKLYGLFMGIEGGAKKPFRQKLCGT